MLRAKMTREDYIKKIGLLYENKYELISDFISSQEEVTIKHLECGKKFDIIANEFTRKRVQERFIKACPKCRNMARAKESVQKEIDELTKNRVLIIGEYKSMHKNTTFQCRECEHKWEGNAHYLISNVRRNKTDSFGCPKCSKKIKKDTSVFKKEVSDLVGEEYSVIGEYEDTNTTIDMQHNTCGHVYPVRPVDFLYKHNRCPECANEEKDSKAVKFIKSLLDDNNYKYETEKEFEDCKYKKKLPFDIYFPEINLLLEYDGQQHFRHMGGLFNDIDNCKVRDNIKNQWCMENNVNFIRLHYKMNFSDIETLILGLMKSELEMTIVDKYNLYYKSEDSELINDKEYYTGINKNYFA